MSAESPGSLLIESPSSYLSTEPDLLAWDEFLCDLSVCAESLLAQRLDEETYVAQVVNQLRRVPLLTIPSRYELAKHFLWEIIEFRFAEGAGLPPHDHQRYNGVILILEGQVHIRSYNILDPNYSPPTGSWFLIQETENRIFTAGEFLTLTTRRDNIHEIYGGPGGCRLLDIFTWFGPSPQSVFIKVGECPIEPRTNIYKASFLE
jgi:hypothetical protein